MAMISIATWNTQWATRSSDRGPRISAILEAVDSDVIVVTEGVRELLPATGSVVDAGGDWGYGSKPDRRKVIVWARFPLTQDFIGAEGATRGRLAVTTADTPTGPVRIVGVCIPWRDAHVSTGRGNASPWSEHMDYLDRLARLLAELEDDIPTVIAGDCNQRIPRGRQPIRVAERLSDVLAGWTIHTAGALPNGPHIDHIATRRGLVLESASDWPAADHLGRLSDHAGVACRLVYAEHSMQRTVGGSSTERGRAEQENGDTDIPGGDVAAGRPLTPASTPSSNGELTPELRTDIEDAMEDSYPESASDTIRMIAITDTYNGVPTDEMREEMKRWLRGSSDGLEHGAVLRLMEQGLGVDEIAVERDSTAATVRAWMRSLDQLFTGTMPASKSAALRNSYVYRELLNHPLSHNLISYVMARLRDLIAVNPEVTTKPLQTRPFKYPKGK